jgi:hypothetical protein
MKRSHDILRAISLAACGLLLALPAAADKIYKYVDREGRVTYSSTPPRDLKDVQDITEMDTPQALRPEDVEAAKKRAEEDAKLARELVRERRQTEVEYERIRAAAADRALQEQLIAMQYPQEGVYYPASGYLPYLPMWGVPPVKPRPPFRDPPVFGSPRGPNAPASLLTEPRPVPFRRR